MTRAAKPPRTVTWCPVCGGIFLHANRCSERGKTTALMFDLVPMGGAAVVRAAVRKYREFWSAWPPIVRRKHGLAGAVERMRAKGKRGKR